jgi:hypothetical protein
MKKIFLISLFVYSSNASFSQNRNLELQLRLPIQFDMQKAEITFSYGNEIKKANSFNFGFDALINYNNRKIFFNIGVGLFRNQFNIQRGYDHQALNIGRDSLPIGTDAKNYTYLIFRVPSGLSIEVSKLKNMDIKVGVEHFFSFSFQRKYNGRVPFEGANTVYHGFTYFGNSLNLFINLSNHLQKNKIEVEPYIRIYNRYKKDKFLKENENETVTRSLDAFGIGFKYSFTL